MLTRSWRLRVAPLAPARRSPWATLASHSLSTSYGGKPASFLASKRRETREERTLAEQFAALPSALEDFIKGTGHLVVPFHFPIPTRDQVIKKKKNRRNFYLTGLVCDVNEIPWRDSALGMNLGSILNKFLKNPKYQAKFPHTTSALIKLGYAVGTQTRAELEWERQTMPALRVFYGIHGHSVVPQDFVVPVDDAQWPVEAWGLRLGKRVVEIRHYRVKWTTQELEDLASVEFVFDVTEENWTEKVLPSLEVFAQVYGHCNVPTKFVVPATEPWSRKAWNLKLGSVVDTMRSQGAYADKVERDASRLEAIEFVWEAHEPHWTKCILPSLEAYYGEHNDCLVSKSFVVPSRAPYPRPAWGLRLGVVVNSIRLGGYAEQVARDANRLQAIDFAWSGVQGRWDTIVLPALEAFFLVHGHCHIRQRFIVPSEEPWPKSTWGFKLGLAYNSMKNYGVHAARRRQDRARLEAIGFPIKCTDEGKSE